MDPDSIAPMVVLVVLILTAGGVAVLRPISRQLAEFLQVLTQERLGSSRARGADRESERMHALLVALESRLAHLEERQGFTEALLEAGPHAAASPPRNGTRAVAHEPPQDARQLPTG
jgi:hypothetical protein